MFDQPALQPPDVELSGSDDARNRLLKSESCVLADVLAHFYVAVITGCTSTIIYEFPSCILDTFHANHHHL